MKDRREEGPGARGSPASPGGGTGARSRAPGAKGVAAPANAARKRPFDSFRENVDAIAVAIVLALIIRHFSVEAFEIPTGSMAPTLFGIHVWVRCPDCDTEFNIGLRSDPNSGVITTQHDKHTVYWGACPTCKLPHHRYQHDEGEPKAT